MIKEVKTDKPAWPCCPLMSGHPVQVAPPQGSIMQPNQVAIGPMMLPCVERDCPLYDYLAERCCLAEVITLSRNFAAMHDRLLDLKLVLEPPMGSPSPLMRVADSLAKIVENLKEKRVVE